MTQLECSKGQSDGCIYVSRVLWRWADSKYSIFIGIYEFRSINSTSSHLPVCLFVSSFGFQPKWISSKCTNSPRDDVDFQRILETKNKSSHEIVYFLNAFDEKCANEFKWKSAEINECRFCWHWNVLWFGNSMTWNWSMTLSIFWM